MTGATAAVSGGVSQPRHMATNKTAALFTAGKHIRNYSDKAGVASTKKNKKLLRCKSSLLWAQIYFKLSCKTQRRIFARRHPASVNGVTHLPFRGSPFTPSPPFPSPACLPACLLASPFPSPSHGHSHTEVSSDPSLPHFCGSRAPARRAEWRVAPVQSILTRSRFFLFV